MAGTKKILITGASGFLGKVIHKRLMLEEFEIHTLGRTKAGLNHHMADFNKNDFVLPDVRFSRVIHLAGKAHVYPRTEEEVKEFDQINFKATQRLLEELERNNSIPEVFIFASTVAVYGNDQGEGITESHKEQAITPYGISKLNAEQAIIHWCDQHSVKYIILRLPLIAGENPPGNLGSIKAAIKKGMYFSIKNNTSRKSIVLAEDIADLIARDHWQKSGVYNLTDGVHPTFNQVEEAIEKAVGKKIPLSLNSGIVKILARCGDIALKLKLPSPLNSQVVEKMTNSLTFDDNKAREELGWKPHPVLPFIEKYI